MGTGKMRRLLTLLITVSLLLSTTLQPASGSDVGSDGQIQASADFFAPMTPGYVGYSVYGALSIQAGLPAIFNGKRICAQPDEACLSDATFLHYAPGYFESCSQTSNSPCVESLEARMSPDQPWIKATFLREVSYKASASEQANFIRGMQNAWPNSQVLQTDVGLGWDYQPSTQLPGSAGGPLIFDIPDVRNASGSTQYTLDARYEISSGVANGKLENPNVSNLTLSIRPTQILAGNFLTPVRGNVVREGNQVGLSGATGGNIDRTFETSTEKGVAKAFGSQDTEFRLTVLLPKNTVGWFHGRIIDPNIEISQANTSQIKVAITGKPAKAPIASRWMSYQEAISTDSNLINPGWPSDIIDRLKSGQTTGGDEWNTWGGLDGRFQAWAKYLPQKAQGFANLWMLNTLPAQQTSSKCFDNAGQLVGLLTTNAMAYQAGAPQFKDGFLDYKVSGVHLDYKSEVYKGTYDLIIRSDVARCLYGFNQTPISATISVIDTEQGASTATTTMTESDGWVRFSAKNFTFSTKEVRVKISQPKYQAITGFTKNKALVSPAMKAAIKRTIASSMGSTYTCVGYYSKSGSKALAIARATATCAAAKSINRSLIIEVLSFSTANAKLDTSVQVARR